MQTKDNEKMKETLKKAMAWESDEELEDEVRDLDMDELEKVAGGRRIVLDNIGPTGRV